MDELDFNQIQNDKANDLTDKIMAKIGELFLKKEIGPNDNIFGVGTSVFGPIMVRRRSASWGWWRWE